MDGMSFAVRLVSVSKFIQQVFPEHLICAAQRVLGARKVTMLKTEQVSFLMEQLF